VTRAHAPRQLAFCGMIVAVALEREQRGRFTGRAVVDFADPRDAAYAMQVRGH
jgi:hypothetical protein